MGRPALDGVDFRNRRCELLKDRGGSVGAAVVDHDNLVRDTVEPQLEVQVANRRGNAAFLVAGGNDDRQKSQWSRHRFASIDN
jgi:hypothetical protein